MWMMPATVVRCRASVSARPSRTTPTVTKGTNSNDTNVDHHRCRPCRRAWSHPAHRFFVSPKCGCGNYQDGELASGKHHHLSRARKVEGGTATHDRHDAVEQGYQRRPRHHRSDHGPRSKRNAEADQRSHAAKRD